MVVPVHCCEIFSFMIRVIIRVISRYSSVIFPSPFYKKTTITPGDIYQKLERGKKLIGMIYFMDLLLELILRLKHYGADFLKTKDKSLTE